MRVVGRNRGEPAQLCWIVGCGEVEGGWLWLLRGTNVRSPGINGENCASQPRPVAGHESWGQQRACTRKSKRGVGITHLSGIASIASAPDQKGWEKPMEKGEISITYRVNKLLGSWDVH